MRASFLLTIAMFALAGVADSSRPLELRGDNIYRYATIKIDTRNLGVNR